MKLRKRKKIRKAPPPTVLSFNFQDDSGIGIPTAEAFALQIEQAAQLKAAANATFEHLRMQGRLQADAARDRAFVTTELERLRAQRSEGDGAQHRARVTAELARLLAEGQWEAEAAAARDRALVAAERIRSRAVAQMQSIIDTAVHHHSTAGIAAQRSAQTRTAAGAITRGNFAVALAAVIESGQEPTATTILDNWPDGSPPKVRRVQELLKEHRQASDCRSPNDAR